MDEQAVRRRLRLALTALVAAMVLGWLMFQAIPAGPLGALVAPVYGLVLLFLVVYAVLSLVRPAGRVTTEEQDEDK